VSPGSDRKRRARRALGRGLRRCVSRRRSPLLRRLAAAALAAALLAGCGAARTSAGSGAKAAPAAPKPPRISGKLRAEEAAIHQQVLASLAQDAGATGRYGTIPVDLRNKQAAPRDQALHASTAHPAMAIQGNGVVLQLAHGSALATAVGPDIPERIQGSADLHTPATWDLTFADVHGTVPLSAGLFTITDEQGALLSPRVSTLTGRPIPKSVPAGRPFTLVLRTTVSVGDGKLRYSPTGPAWLAEWDFDVETD
jgi:hypothetical protein